MRLTDEEYQRWYCDRDNDVFFADDETVADWLLAINPNNADALQVKARALNKMGRCYEAASLCRTALAIDQSRADIWYEKARCESKIPDSEAALASLEKACQLEGSYATFAFCEKDFEALRDSPRFRDLVERRGEELRRLFPHIDVD